MSRPSPALRSSLVLSAILLLPAAVRAQNPTYVPQRVYDTKQGRFVDFEEMTVRMAQADVVMFGEVHGDPDSHRLERALLEGLARRRENVVVSLEMFERDVQPLVDGYLANRIPEDEFLAKARPWLSYQDDYRPLVEFARASHWPVVAANVPRPIAAAVAGGGLAALDTLDAATRPFAAAELDCPHDAYYDLFAETMKGHAPPPGTVSADTSVAADTTMLHHFFLAQCLRDETMAEAIVQGHERAGEGSLVVHYTGAFHSDRWMGTTARVVRRLPDAKIVTLSCVPVFDLDAVNPTDEQKQWADYLLFTIAPPGANTPIER